MEKRTKLWRRKQGFRVFKARMIYYASFEREYYYADGSHQDYRQLAMSEERTLSCRCERM